MIGDTKINEQLITFMQCPKYGKLIMNLSWEVHYNDKIRLHNEECYLTVEKNDNNIVHIVGIGENTFRPSSLGMYYVLYGIYNKASRMMCY